jgi:phosphohistidine swiveling domain-containing protein
VQQSPYEHIGSAVPFPFRSSAIGRKLTVGDLCVGVDNVKQSSWDSWTAVLVTHHNLNSLLDAFVTANAIMDMGLTAPSTVVEAEQHAPAWLVGAVRVVHRVFDAKDPIAELNRSKRQLMLAAAPAEDDEQEDTRFDSN